MEAVACLDAAADMIAHRRYLSWSDTSRLGAIVVEKPCHWQERGLMRAAKVVSCGSRDQYIVVGEVTVRGVAILSFGWFRPKKEWMAVWMVGGILMLFFFLIAAVLWRSRRATTSSSKVPVEVV